MNEPDLPADRTADAAGSQFSLDRNVESAHPSATSYRSGHDGEPERLAVQSDANRPMDLMMLTEAVAGQGGELIAVDLGCADGSLTVDRFIGRNKKVYLDFLH